MVCTGGGVLAVGDGPRADAMGAPQLGHAGALLDTCLSQSGQLIRAISRYLASAITYHAKSRSPSAKNSRVQLYSNGSLHLPALVQFGQ